jgi:hypothetical protein
MNALEQWIEFARLSAIGARQFPTGLEGLGFSEFVILHYLKPPGEQMRRIDLADKLGPNSFWGDAPAASDGKTGIGVQGKAP